MLENSFEQSTVNIDANKLRSLDAAKQFHYFKSAFGIFGKTELDDLLIVTSDEIEESTQGGSPTKKLDRLRSVSDLSLRHKRRVILGFIISTFLAADWYTNAMSRSWRFRALYGVASLALMLMLPIGIYYIQILPGTVGASSWAAQLSAILTGLLAVQKTMATWLDTHRRYGDQWRARAGLRDLQYSLETKWTDRAVLHQQQDSKALVFADDFIIELESAVIRSRALIRAEQQSFFDTYSSPTPDILSGLTNARVDVASLIAAYKPQEVSNKTEGAVDGELMAEAGVSGLRNQSSAQAASGALQLCGQTDHFSVLFDPQLGDSGRSLATALLSTCESDLVRLLTCFDRKQPPPSFNIHVTSRVGASHLGCLGTAISVGVGTTPTPSLHPFAKQQVMAEITEVLAAQCHVPWNCGDSNGEALSRVLGSWLYPDALPDKFLSAQMWLNGSRSDWINVSPRNNDTEFIPIGCAVLFLNWMHFQLDKSWFEIISSGAPTLAEVYDNVIASSEPTDGYQRFRTLVDRMYPVGSDGLPQKKVVLKNDNPFPFIG